MICESINPAAIEEWTTIHKSAAALPQNNPDYSCDLNLDLDFILTNLTNKQNNEIIFEFDPNIFLENLPSNGTPIITLQPPDLLSPENVLTIQLPATLPLKEDPTTNPSTLSPESQLEPSPPDPHKPSRKSYACDACHMSFAEKSQMNRHHAEVHEKSRRFICRDCGFRFKRLAHLLVHERRGHSGYKRHTCDKIFARRNHLTLHVRTQHEITEFVCPQCERRFASACGLGKHRKTCRKSLKS